MNPIETIMRAARDHLVRCISTPPAHRPPWMTRPIFARRRRAPGAASSGPVAPRINLITLEEAPHAH